MGSRRDEEGGGADASGTTARNDPVALHPGSDAEGRQGHGVGLLSKFQVTREPVDVQGGVDYLELQAQKAPELQEASPEGVHVDLQRVAKIDQHVLTLRLPARNVQARGDDVSRLPALNEVLLHRDLEEPVGGVDEETSEAQPTGDVLRRVEERRSDKLVLVYIGGSNVIV